jgi:hypothetical protein
MPSYGTKHDDGTITCYKCQVRQPISNFQTQYNGKYINTQCKKCVNKNHLANTYATEIGRFRERARSLRKRCKANGIPCDIDAEYLMELYKKQNGLCFYSDYPLQVLGRNLPKNQRVSLDKVIPELGYIKGNVVLCIDRINSMKYNATLEEMKKWMPGWYQRLADGGFISG